MKKMTQTLLSLFLLAVSAQAQIQLGQIVSPRISADGTQTILRADRTSAQVGTLAHGDFHEAASRGSVYLALAKTITVVATCDIAPLPAAGCPIIGLFNPVSTGKQIGLSILKVGCDTVSGTPGGPFYLDGIAQPTAITQTASSTTINTLTFATSGSIAKAYAQGTITGSVAATTLRPLCGAAAIATGAGNYNCDDEIKGSIVVAPGNFLGVSAHAVGTTHIVSCYMLWEEVPL